MNVSALRSVVHDVASRRRFAGAFRANIAATLRDMLPRQRRILICLGAWSVLMLLLAAIFCLCPTGLDLDGAPLVPATVRSGAETAADMTRAIESRPLFAPSRRALPVGVPLARAPVSPRDRTVRLGGVLRDASAAKAFLVSNDQPLGAWLAVGDRIGGWTIAAIEPSHVDLQADSDSFVVTMPGTEKTPPR